MGKAPSRFRDANAKSVHPNNRARTAMSHSQDNPKVSVIIPTYNRADLLPRAVNSVLAQTYDDCEIIIVDDCSPDNTQDVIASFTDPRVRSIRHEVNRGAATARNTGIENARGEYIAFLDDDDELTPGSIARRVNLLDESPPDVGMICGNVKIVDDSTGAEVVMDLSGSLPDQDMATRCLAADLPTPPSAMLVRASAVREVGAIDSRYNMMEDKNFACRLALRYGIKMIPEIYAIYHASHGHSQMTDDYQDWVDALERHIADFRNELALRPKAFASALTQLPVHHLMARRRIAGFRMYAQAVRRNKPGFRATCFATARLIKIFLWYSPPLFLLREPARKFRNRMKAMFRGPTNGKSPEPL